MVPTEEGAAYGAAVLAQVGAGQFATVDAATEQLIAVEPVASPGPDVETYRHAHGAYRDLYPALKPTFDHMAQVST